MVRVRSRARELEAGSGSRSEGHGSELGHTLQTGMIVITGPGRSGTSFLAGLYSELGFDTGGTWNPDANAGLEDFEIRDTNLELAEQLGVSIRERRGGRTLQLVSRSLKATRGRVSPKVRRPVVRAVDALRYANSTPDLMRWDVVSDVAERYGARLRSLAMDRQVVKDPRFCFTLRVWMASGAAIDSVVFTIRPLEAMADSRLRARMYRRSARDWARHNYCYGTGLLFAAATEYRLPVVVLRYPDFLSNAQELFEALPMPAPVSEEQFTSAFDAVYDPSLVHDDR
jgi:hypothetical protein